MKKKIVAWLMLSVFCLFAVRAMAEYKCFYANLHAHTSYSDGESTPDTAFAYARDVALIDIQALTDHNNGGYDYNPALYQKVQQAADSFTVDGVFVALAGQEIGLWSSNGFGHINIFEAPEFLAYNYGDLLGTYRLITDLDRPAMFNHPVPGPYDCPNFNNLRYYADYSQTMDLLEVMNNDYIYENAYLLALSNGWQVGASANQDNHKDRKWGNRPNTAGRIPLTGIWADTLTKTSVLEALQARRTFAMMAYPATDRMEVSLKSGEYWQGEHYITPNTSINFQIRASADSAFKKIYLYTDGIVSDSLSLNAREALWNLDKEVKWGKHYFFVKAVQTDNDLAWTSPLFIDVLQDDPKTKVVTWPTPVVDDCQIVYQPLAGVTKIKVRIYDAAGNKIWEHEASDPSVVFNWNSKDLNGTSVPNGLYIIKIEQNSPTQTSITIGKTAVSR